LVEALSESWLELGALFLSAFVSATILPGTSEAVLIGVLATASAAVWAAVGIATIGNLLGSMLNWAIGKYLASFRDHKRFPVSPEKIAKAEALYAKYGIWTLLLSWLPLFGDALTIVAGLLRAPLWIFILFVTIAKGARYAAVAGAVGLGLSFWK
jgi:membrane protein YqaA with SNARE-associated domain